MKCSSAIRMLLALLFTFTLLPVCAAAGKTPPGQLREQKVLQEDKNPLTISATTITFKIPATTARLHPTATTSLSTSGKAKTLLLKDITNKAPKISALQAQFKAKSTAHHAFLAKKITSIVGILEEIAGVLAGSQGRSREARILQQILFPKNAGKDGKDGKSMKDNKIKLQELLRYLETVAVDNQQVDFERILKLLDDVVLQVQELEKEIVAWEVYCRGVEGKVKVLFEELESEMKMRGEGGKEKVMGGGFGDTLGSVKGVMVRVKSWLSMAKAVDETGIESEIEDKNGERERVV
ncbi:hypothetical protein IFR05_004225 [Cadophora sp. M221]|nr:hypothetical protein IFR05_004225 [Cadophora sp. M221]